MAVSILTYRDEFFPSSIDIALWRQVKNNFGVCVNFIENTVVEVEPEKTVVFDEEGEIPLADFEHPEDAVYLFGCTGMHNVHKQFPDAKSVRIEVPDVRPTQGIFGQQAAAIVMYDREMKRDC